LRRGPIQGIRRFVAGREKKNAGPAANHPLGVHRDATRRIEDCHMGLDLALGGLILVSAIRGWLKGFLTQAIRLAGVVAAVYAAAPIREQVKPYVADQFPSIRPEVLDRILWWGAAVASYFLLVGVTGMVVSVSRRQTFGVAEPNRGDQFAGFGLGVIKGLIVASFVVAGLHRYAEPQLVQVTWAEDQKRESFAWSWNEQYHPAARIWSAPPVQHFVQHVQKMGLLNVPAKGKPDADAETPAEKPVQTASRTPKLELASASPPAPPARSRGLVRKPLVLKKPFELPAGRRNGATGASAPASTPPPGLPDLSTEGVDPEMAGLVQSILGKLQVMDGAPLP
jgi:uncharacterized membrane protein required for colicin V production